MLDLVPLAVRYSLSRLARRRPDPRSLHEFSQLMVLSPNLLRIYGMTSVQERAYFCWFAKHIFRGQGEMVDLGCWLGSTTISLAMGLAENPRSEAAHRRIQAYDAFVWTPNMNRHASSTMLRGRLQPGQSFLEEFKRRTEPWKGRIVVHAGDLSQSIWPGSDIELLLVDAMKSWPLTNNILRQFYPALIPGVSYVIQQDFSHWFTPWIHLVHYRLRPYFEPAYDVPRASSFVFRLVAPIPGAVLAAEQSFASFTDDEIDAAFEHSRRLVLGDKNKEQEISAAKVMVFLHLGDLDRAQRELEAFKSKGLSFDAALGTVEARLRQMRVAQT